MLIKLRDHITKYHFPIIDGVYVTTSMLSLPRYIAEIDRLYEMCLTVKYNLSSIYLNKR